MTVPIRLLSSVMKPIVFPYIASTSKDDEFVISIYILC